MTLVSLVAGFSLVTPSFRGEVFLDLGAGGVLKEYTKFVNIRLDVVKNVSRLTVDPLLR